MLYKFSIKVQRGRADDIEKQMRRCLRSKGEESRTMTLSLDKHLTEAFRLTLWSRHVCLNTNRKYCHSLSKSKPFDVVFTQTEKREMKEGKEVEIVGRKKKKNFKQKVEENGNLKQGVGPLLSSAQFDFLYFRHLCFSFGVLELFLQQSINFQREINKIQKKKGTRASGHWKVKMACK